jgi:hypothetical protein
VILPCVASCRVVVGRVVSCRVVPCRNTMTLKATKMTTMVGRKVSNTTTNGNDSLRFDAAGDLRRQS